MWVKNSQRRLTSDYAKSNNLTPFISMQNFHNAAYREEEREMVPTVEVSNMTVVTAHA